MKNPIIFLLKKVSWPKRLLFFSIFLNIFASLLTLTLPLFSKNIIDNFNSSLFNNGLILFWVFLFIIASLFEGLSFYLLSILGGRTILSIRESLWKHMIHLPISFYDKNEIGELMSRITEDTSVVNSFVSERAPTAIRSIITLVGGLFCLFALDWQLTIIACIILPVFLVALIPLSKIVECVSEETQNQIAKFNSILAKVFYDIRLIKSCAYENEEIIKAKNNLLKIYKLKLKESKIRAIIVPISNMVIMLVAIIVLGYGGVKVAQNDISTGTLIAMIFYIIQLTQPILNLSLLFTDYQESIGASKRIFNIYEEKLENYNEKSKVIPNSGSIEFKNVSFSYENSKIVINNLSFILQKNQFTAIVGPSGSGKTTIFNLIERFYTPDSGVIKYCSEDINHYDLKEWRDMIGIVMQDSAILSGTVEENLVYGLKREITRKQVISYAKKAFCDQFIIKLPDGYQTKVGERGTKLSGGEKQRISIARVFLKQSPIILLDEATSSLDSESERIIQSAIAKVFKNKTVIVIAHRLSTIKQADKIIFMDSGNITGIGTHENLYKSHYKYKLFVDTQSIKD